jgi:hypothetical protein
MWMDEDLWLGRLALLAAADDGGEVEFGDERFPRLGDGEAAATPPLQPDKTAPSVRRQLST